MVISRYTRRIKFVAIILVVLFIISMLAMCVATFIPKKTEEPEASTEQIVVATTSVIEEPEIVLNDLPVLFEEVEYVTMFDIQLCEAQLELVKDAVDSVDAAIESGSFTEEAINKMRQELVRLDDIIIKIEQDITKYKKWEDEYYYATQVWLYCRNLGYSEAVTSALIGNMMVETSGGSLKLKPTIYSKNKTFYGLCQWSKGRRPWSYAASVEEQLAWLHKSMPGQFKTFGKIYKKGFKYDDFLAMEDHEQAALAFAKVYERCGKGSYNKRMRCATKAYNYFVLGE